jgi:hypothetical protein
MRETLTNLGVVGEILLFFWQRKLWWLIPLILILMLCGVLVFASASGVGPFIYTLF